MDSRADILKRDFSESFVNKMKNAIEMSHCQLLRVQDPQLAAN